ncbi:hypothetical protein AAC387_Pa02g0015 [Persea americana]
MLKLPTKKHPAPYKLSWFKRSNEIPVTRKALVSFSIGGRYHEDVRCDVAPMDVTHILLGRPWQYDRRTLHDGYKNTYTFYKDNAKIVFGTTREKINTKPTFLGDVSNFSGDKCDEEIQKEEIMEHTDVENVEDDLNSPPIFDEYVEDDIQEVNLENQIFDKGQDEQVDVAENQVGIEFVQKPECILPTINVAPEIVPNQECRLQVVTLEDRPKSEYVDPLWEAIERQQEASQQIREVANQIESSISITSVINMQHHEDNLKRQTEQNFKLLPESAARRESADTNGNTKMQTRGRVLLNQGRMMQKLMMI